MITHSDLYLDKLRAKQQEIERDILSGRIETLTLYNRVIGRLEGIQLALNMYRKSIERNNNDKLQERIK